MMEKLLSSALPRGAAGAPAASRPAPHEQTRRNLIASLQAASMAHSTYLLYAAHARRDGDDGLARLFERLAADKLEHFVQQAELIELAGSVVDNLRAAIESEHYEVDTMLREYATKAGAAGDTPAAALFADLRAACRRHEKALRRALAEAPGEGDRA